MTVTSSFARHPAIPVRQPLQPVSGFIAGALLIGLFTLTVVLPNSLRTIAVAFLVSSALALPWLAGLKALRNPFFAFLFASVPITLFYVLVGIQHGASDVAATQVPIIYVLTPLLWGLVCCSVRRLLSPKAVVTWLVAGLWLAGLTVLYFFVAFLTLGPDAVGLFAAEPNLESSAVGYVTTPVAPNLGVTPEGYVAATMQVYGSLIFVVGGLFASPGVIRNRIVRAASLVVAIAIALTSGRVALLLAIPIGLLVYALAGFSDRHSRLSARLRPVMVIAGAAMAAALITFAFGVLFGWNLAIDLAEVVDKLAGGGDETRRTEMSYLMAGVADHWGLGAGHGVPASVVRLPQFPWRYELLWAATLFRVGLLGAAVYAAPFVVALWRGGGDLARGRLTIHERFLFGGFVAAFAASNSNPYLEGFVFQWMVVLPLVYFLPARPQAAPARPGD
jgi:hypothetical protein